ncbi:uncharacterized protein PHACADRAFT_255136 [Phanerochaete carnosa HHB-10118-sp]|uniref:Uncharacterized protein n=1 Tax=Phanerochaete carnosa (strain HHB-10118-sp) TaxID=650164 RepID=K5UXV5_PHACS|nr:uncharacterized protein PHACADRAFT_255136 [Phanerochaete carnosa HHB-10118-sp]EKM54926.1 hypothetical protein PHACADRAFT_255136 [Phanerochaete carnosa HHB-10118-sp]
MYPVVLTGVLLLCVCAFGLALISALYSLRTARMTSPVLRRGDSGARDYDMAPAGLKLNSRYL